MSFLPDITPLTNKITEFTHSQQQSQAQIIALLKQIHFELTQIDQTLKTNKICQILKT